MDPQTVSALGSLSGPALMAAAILTGARGYWVWGWAHREQIAIKDAIILQKEKEIEYYRDATFRLANLVEKTTGVAVQQTGQPPWSDSSD